MVTVLYDGWSLVYEPNSPAAIHLLTMLALHPQGIQAAVGMPGEPFHTLPEGVSLHSVPTLDTPVARIRWEQRTLPAMAAESEARLVHLTDGAPALFASQSSLISPGRFGAFQPHRLRPSGRGFASRLREALLAGGLRRTKEILWPLDLPSPSEDLPFRRIPPVVHPSFTGNTQPTENLLVSQDLPDTYVLYHGPTTSPDLRRLMEAWVWAADAIGEYNPLLVLGLADEGRERLSILLDEYGVGETVRPLPVQPIDGLVRLYRGCSALIHPAPISPWGGSIRSALACGKPIVGIESQFSDAIVGEAGYLVDYAAGGRSLGAALITIIVEETVAEQLTLAARGRAAKWETRTFTQNLGEAYRSLI